LPPTIKHAIRLTEAVGKRYLWVDRLCVSESRPDQLIATLPRMGTIYNLAYLTIVAASETDVQSGLSRLEQSPSNTDLFPCFGLPSHGEPVILETMTDTPLYKLDRSKWATRGWTYQERKLSNRNVVFTEHEVFFECSHTIVRERYTSTFDHHRQNKTLPMAGNEYGRQADYGADVGAYTQRNLTFLGDRLDAFSGVLHDIYVPQMQDQRTDVLNGLPLKAFQVALCWTQGGTWDWPTRIHTDKLNNRRFPSWSWAGWSNWVTYQLYHTRLTFEGAWCEVQILDNNNIFLPVSSAHFSGTIDRMPTGPSNESVLHLWTKCLRVRLTSNYKKFHGDRQVCIGIEDTDIYSSETIMYATTLGIMEPDRAIYIAHIFTEPDRPRESAYTMWEGWEPGRGCWMLLDGDLRQAERGGLVVLGPADQRVFLQHARDEYVRMF